LRQLHACAAVLLEANGSFVVQVDLFRVARQIDPTLAHVQKATQQEYNPRFRPWLMRYLYPAVQEHVHERGVAGHKQTRVSFYMCPNGAASARNLKASFQTLLAAADERDVCNRLRELPVQKYMELLPDHASQRVLRSLLLEVSGSTSFLNGAFGFNIGSLHRARQRVDLALLHSAQCEMQAQSVRSDLTVAGQHTRYLQSVREARAVHLEDEHAGGAVSAAEQCETAGLNLKTIIEEAADELGEFSFEEVAARAEEGATAIGSARISDARGSHGEEAAERSKNCTWKNLTTVVVTKVKKTLPEFKMDERTLRCYCVAQRKGTAEAARHVGASQAAKVAARKPASSREEWNIDMHESSAAPARQGCGCAVSAVGRSLEDRAGQEARLCEPQVRHAYAACGHCAVLGYGRQARWCEGGDQLDALHAAAGHRPGACRDSVGQQARWRHACLQTGGRRRASRERAPLDAHPAVQRPALRHRAHPRALDFHGQGDARLLHL
jgi:hypothetical protein